MDESIAEQLARRDRLRSRLEGQISFDQRVKEMFDRMERGNGVQMTPEGWDHFIRRNFRERAERTQREDERSRNLPHS